jgi:hypothetical protein
MVAAAIAAAAYVCCADADLCSTNNNCRREQKDVKKQKKLKLKKNYATIQVGASSQGVRRPRCDVPVCRNS